ncbi:MAG: hypothetical protein IJM51_08540 [Clostridia bacterium]|nr:hypothetical protein [Clostridia bacterium]
MKERFPLYPEDMSNDFGRANELGSNGGIFDSKGDKIIRQNKADKSEKKEKPDTSEIVHGNQIKEQDKLPFYDKQEDDTIIKPANSVPPAGSDKAQKKNHSGKNVFKKGLVLVAGIFLAVIVSGVVYLSTHAILGELFGKHEFYSLNATEIDLSGSDFTDYSQLSRITSLEVVNLTNSPFSRLSDLYACKNLKEVILADRVLSPENCIEFYKRLPDALLVCRVDINGQIYDSGITEIKLHSANPESIKDYAALCRLAKIDLTEAAVSIETLKAAFDSFPDCTILANVALNGSEYKSDIEYIKLKGVLSDQDVQAMAFFRNLKKIDVVACKNPEILDQFISDNPDIKISVPYNLLGKTVGTEDEVVDLRGNKYTLSQVQDALKQALPKLKSLKKIDMCGCGLNNKEMEKLCEAYPDIKFVWMIAFGHWHLRTDAVAFAALNSNGEEFYNQDHYAPIFKYCTDLRALDLGHSLITDISDISSLKKLRAVILTDNKIRNIDAFAELHDLEFIEMNATNNVTSLEPLRNLNNLRFVNLWNSSDAKDLSPLYHHDKLEIAILDRSVPKEEREKFIASNPDCKSFFYVDYTLGLTTTKEWRENPYRVMLKHMFRTDRAFFNWQYVTGFDEETGEYIIDYTTDQYRYK